MKIRKGFVTNSSSTSFLISLKEDWRKDSFMSAVGANSDSPMNRIFEDLFESIDYRKKDIRCVVEEQYNKDLTVSKFLENDGFDQETVEMVEKLIADGRIVYYGSMHSDSENCSETYFCCRSFVVCENDIYFNGSIGSW